jgi:hypothetical protein
MLLTTGCTSLPPGAGLSRQPARTIADVSAMESQAGVVVMVKSNQPLVYTTSRQEHPRGVRLVFPATAMESPNAIYFPFPNPIIRSIRTEDIDRGSETRIFLELEQDAPYEVIPNPDGLRIVFRRLPAVTTSAGMPAVSAIETPAHTPTAAARWESDAPIMTPPASDPAASVLRDVRTQVVAHAVLIHMIADGTIRTANVFTLENPARIVFDVMGLQSVFQGEQRISVRSEWASQVRHHGYPNKVRLVVDTAAHHLKSYHLEPTADGLVIRVGTKNP